MSNSSSSSFIVGFAELPQTIGQTYDLLFADGRRVVDPFPEWSSESDRMSAGAVAERVFKDLQEAEEITTYEQFVEAIDGGWFPGRSYDVGVYDQVHDLDREFYEEHGRDAKMTDFPAFMEMRSKLCSECAEEYRRQRLEETRRFAEPEWERLKGLKLRVFWFADDEGESTLEHGDVFRCLPHVVISHH